MGCWLTGRTESPACPSMATSPRCLSSQRYTPTLPASQKPVPSLCFCNYTLTRNCLDQKCSVPLCFQTHY